MNLLQMLIVFEAGAMSGIFLLLFMQGANCKDYDDSKSETEK